MRLLGSPPFYQWYLMLQTENALKRKDIHPSPLSGRSTFWNLRKKDYLSLVCSLLNNHRPEGCHWWDGEGGLPEAPGSVAQDGTERLFCRKRLHPRLLLWGLHKTLVLPVSPWVSKYRPPTPIGPDEDWSQGPAGSHLTKKDVNFLMTTSPLPGWVLMTEVELNCLTVLLPAHMASSATTHPVGYVFVHTVKQLHAFVHFRSN